MPAHASVTDRNRLIEQHFDLVRSVATGVQLSYDVICRDFDELVGFGIDGLLDAADRFDPTRGFAFEAFGRRRIRGAILDGLRDSGWLSPDGVVRFRRGSTEPLAVLTPLDLLDVAAEEGCPRGDDIARALGNERSPE